MIEITFFFRRFRGESGFKLKRLLAVAFIGLAPAACSSPSPAAEGARAPAFSESPAVREFIAEMQARHGFDAARLTRRFASIRSNPAVLQAIRPAAVPELQRSWQRYRARFLNEQRFSQGLRFWQTHNIALVRAEAIYGVPREIIVAIIGVETEYGRNTGKFGVLEALATLAFDYPPRALFFRGELEQFLLMARESGVPPSNYKGSYAGASGIPQFMPSSQRSYAVDFDGDGRIDLSGSASDAIGSVAHFLNTHGWQSGEPVAVPARVNGDALVFIAAGIKPSFTLREMLEQGLSPCFPDETDRFADAPAALIDLVTPDQPTEYWIGFGNFYVITRYNRSSFYAMSVFQLAEALRKARNPKTRFDPGADGEESNTAP
jgi:membrane-bound lytic murein transglycosylase B